MARKGFKIADAYVEIHDDKTPLRESVRKLPAEIGPDADRAGRGIGDKLSQGLQMSLIRNSPLIAAAVGGGLAAGAPLALAGAGVLFAGIGALATTQSSAVRAAWKTLGSDIAQNSLSDARELVPVVAGMADDIGDAYERNRPRIRGAFEDAAPQLDKLSDSAIRAAELALPGLTRAVERGTPVMGALGSMLESTGSGLTEFFDGMSEHSEEAGVSLEAIGDILGSGVLPMLGDLLGTGTQIASYVLPTIATVAEGAADALEQIDDVLPLVVGGFAAMRVTSLAASGLANVSAAASRVAQNMAEATYSTDGFARGSAERASGAAGRMSSAVGRASDMVGRMGAAIPIAGAAVAMVASEMSEAEAQTDSWANAMMEGGASYAKALEEIEAERGKYGDNWVGELSYEIDQWAGIASSVDEAREKYNDMLDAMSPLQRAQTLQTKAQNDLNYAISEYGPHSHQAVDAQRQYERQSKIVADEQAELEQAIEGVTQAMLDQADQALASIDSSYAYETAIDDLQEANKAVHEAIRDTGSASEDTRDAYRELGIQVMETARAAGQMASDELPANTSEMERNAAAQRGTLAELIRLRDEMGVNFPDAGNRAIQKLEESGVTLDVTSAAAIRARNMFGALGSQIVGVPNSKYIDVRSPTKDQIRQFQELGFRIEHLPDGTVRLHAETGAAEQALNYAARDRYSTVRQTVVQTGDYRAGVGVNVRRAGGGKITGPGTETSDSIPVLASNNEWYIKAASTRKYGDMAMAAVNAGTATIIANGTIYGYATGGRPTESGPAAVPVPAPGPSGSVAMTRPITVERLEVSIAGTLDLTDQRQLRSVAMQLRDALVSLERENN